MCNEKGCMYSSHMFRDQFAKVRLGENDYDFGKSVAGGRKVELGGGITCVKSLELYRCITATCVTEKTHFPLLSLHPGKMYVQQSQPDEGNTVLMRLKDVCVALAAGFKLYGGGSSSIVAFC